MWAYIFCYDCLGQYQRDILLDDDDNKSKSCPCCRRDISGKVWQASAERFMTYLNRAHKLAKGSAEQKKYAELAIAESNATLSAICGDKTDMVRTRAFFLYQQAEALSLADKPKEMLDVTEKILSANKRHKLDDEKLFKTNIWMAEAHLALGEFTNADDIYNSLGDSDPMDDPHHMQLIFMGMCRTCYELGEYDFAIFHGQMGIRNNRGYQGVHKYVALAQKAKGDIDAAKTTMSRAILYEARWDEGNLNQNKKLLAELHSL